MPPKYKKQRIENEMIKIVYPIVNTILIGNKFINYVSYPENFTQSQ